KAGRIIGERLREIGPGLQLIEKPTVGIVANFTSRTGGPDCHSERRVGDRAIEILLRQSPHSLSALRPGTATDQIINWRMDTAPNPGDPRLVGGIVIRRPLQGDGLGRPIFKA